MPFSASPAFIADQLALLNCRRTSGFSSEEDLKDTLHNYVLDVWRRHHRGVRLYRLNKRFGTAAVKFGTTTRQLCLEFIQAGQIMAQLYKDNLIVLPIGEYPAFLDEMEAKETVGQTSEQRSDYRNRLIQWVFDRTVES